MADKGKGRARITALQLDIIDCLVKGMSQKETADFLKCDKATVSKAFCDPALKEVYFRKCADQVQELIPVAIQRLYEMLTDESVQASVMIACVREVLDRANLQSYMMEQKPPESIKIEIAYI